MTGSIGTEVRATLTYLGERIDTYLPRHPGLRTAVDECGTLVDGLLDRRRHAPAQRAALVWTSRALIVIVLLVVLVATGFAARDAVAKASPLESFEWLPLVESLVNDLVFAGIAIWFLRLARRPGRAATTSSGACTGSARSPTSSTCTRWRGPRCTAARPSWDHRGQVISPRTMSVRDYALYLDYCCELLSLTSPRPPRSVPRSRPTPSCSTR